MTQHSETLMEAVRAVMNKHGYQNRDMADRIVQLAIDSIPSPTHRHSNTKQG